MTLDDPDDKRAYFQRIVDDIKAQIRDGRLDINAPNPSAREMAVLYGVASMTAQRALRELQILRLTYGVPGRGTFVHPDAVDLLRGKLMREPVGDDDPQLRRRVADYLATQDDLFRRFHAARTTAERDQVVTDLVRHADRHRDLIDQTARYQTTHGNQGADPRRQARDQDDEPDTTPAPQRRAPAKATKTTSTARKPTSSRRARPGS
jgi:DNA-binding transcriptional regulator YhcF (GntR family)